MLGLPSSRYGAAMDNKNPFKMIKATPDLLEKLAQECKGRGGSEDEINLAWEAWNPKYVELSTSYLSAVGAIIKRCGSAVTHFFAAHDQNGRVATVTLRISTRHPETKAKVFRGFGYAFAPVDVEKTPFPGLGAKEESEEENE
jgi:hypothetical protein